MIKKGVKVWDIIQVETTMPSEDLRPESRKIKPESIVVIDHIQDRKERRKILDKLSETSLESALNEKRTLTLIKPRIEGFTIKKRPPEPKQVTLEGNLFRLRPYGDLRLCYQWSCPKPCRYCRGKFHNMACFDWGANYLCKKYTDEKEAMTKVKQKCFYEMKYDNDTWFVLGTHSRRPWKKWMIVSLLWMKKQAYAEKKTKSLSEFVKS